MSKKTVLALFRPRDRYLDLLEALDKSGKYDLIVDGQVAQALAQRDIKSDTLETYFDEKAAYWVDKIMKAMVKRVPEVFAKEAFQQQFTFDGRCFFEDIKQAFQNNLLSQFAEEVFLMDAFRRLFDQRDVSLVIVWTDVLRYTKTLTRAAQGRGIPVLQLLHGVMTGRMIGHYENDIFADKIANMSPYNKEVYEFYGRDIGKCVVTGSIELDYTASASTASRDEACEKLGLDPKKPVVAFGTTWAFPCSTWDKEIFDAIGSTYTTFIKAFADLRKDHPDLQLVVKVHPSAAAPFLPAFFKDHAVTAGLDDVVVTAGHLPEAMSACDLLVSHFSSICVDALLLDKHVVILDFMARSDYLFFKDDAFTFVRNPEDTLEAMKAALFDAKFRAEMEKKRERSKHRFTYLNDGNAMERVISLIDEMAK